MHISNNFYIFFDIKINPKRKYKFNVYFLFYCFQFIWILSLHIWISKKESNKSCKQIIQPIEKVDNYTFISCPVAPLPPPPHPSFCWNVCQLFIINLINMVSRKLIFLFFWHACYWSWVSDILENFSVFGFVSIILPFQLSVVFLS